MQTNQSQTKPQHPMLNTILANIEAHTKQELVREPLRSIANVLRDEVEAKSLSEAKLFTPPQNQALCDVQEMAYQILKLTQMMNEANVEWNLGLPQARAFNAGDHLAAIEDRIRLLHRVGKELGVQAVLDNKAGASKYRELKNNQEFLAAVKEKTDAYYQSKQIQKQKEAA